MAKKIYIQVDRALGVNETDTSLYTAGSMEEARDTAKLIADNEDDLVRVAILNAEVTEVVS